MFPKYILLHIVFPNNQVFDRLFNNRIPPGEIAFHLDENNNGRKILGHPSEEFQKNLLDRMSVGFCPISDECVASCGQHSILLFERHVLSKQRK